MRYPNLELLEYKFLTSLMKDEEWVREFKNKKKSSPYITPSITCQVFPQMWGNTNTAFDVNEKGEALFGGQAMTEAYTVVFHERNTDVYGVFVDDKPCYVVKDATKVFYQDLESRNMMSYSEAKKYY